MAWGVDYCCARLQDFIRDCMENRQDNGYPCDGDPKAIAADICTLVKDAEELNPEYLVPFIEVWQREHA